MLETFCDMNLEMARTGNFSTQIGKEQLLRLVAHNNVILVSTSLPACHPDLNLAAPRTLALAPEPSPCLGRGLSLVLSPQHEATHGRIPSTAMAP